MKLQTTIIGTLVLILVVVTGGSLPAIYYLQKTEIEEETKEKNIALTEFALLQSDKLHSDISRLLNPIAYSEEFTQYLASKKEGTLEDQSEIKEALESEFLRVSEAYPDLIRTLRFIGQNGEEEVVVRDQEIDEERTNQQGQAYYTKMIAGNPFQSSQLHFRQTTDEEWLMEWGMAVDYEGEKLGILTLSLPMTGLEELFEPFLIEGLIDAVYVTDWNGKYLFNTRDQEQVMKGSAEEHSEAFTGLLSGETGAVVDSEDGEMMSYATHHDLGIRFMLATANESMIKGLNVVFLKLIQVMGVGSVFAFFVLMFLIRKTVITPIQEIARSLYRLSKGDFTQRCLVNNNNELGNLAETTNDMVGGLVSSFEGIQSVADLLVHDSKEIADSSKTLAVGATQQASALEQISSSVTEMASQKDHNVRNATQTEKLVTETCTDAARGSRQMQEMVKAMTEIKEASQNISGIIKTIDDIAFQTNLLALNAAVEAARAGIHGKGFAVVADEVRNLAIRSAKAAEETTGLIESSVNRVHHGIEITNQTSGALKKIASSIGTVTNLIQEITAASKEQAEGISQIHQGIRQLENVTQQNAAQSEKGAATTVALSKQATTLKEILSQFTLQTAEEPVPSEQDTAPSELPDQTNPSAQPSSEQAMLNHDSVPTIIKDEEAAQLEHQAGHPLEHQMANPSKPLQN